MLVIPVIGEAMAGQLLVPGQLRQRYQDLDSKKGLKVWLKW
jgi:hypothetical protein